MLASQICGIYCCHGELNNHSLLSIIQYSGSAFISSCNVDVLTCGSRSQAVKTAFAAGASRVGSNDSSLEAPGRILETWTSRPPPGGRHKERMSALVWCLSKICE